MKALLLWAEWWMKLLEQLQDGLLRLVGLRKGGHAGLLQNGVLRHLGDSLPDVGVLHVVLGGGQVRNFGVFNVGVSGQTVHGGADRTAVCSNCADRGA